MSTIPMAQKHSMCERFVKDVLRARIVALIEDRRAYVQDAIDKVITPEVQQAHAVLVAAAKNSKGLSSIIDLGEDCDFDGEKLVSTVDCNVINYSFYQSNNSIEINDETYLKSKTTIKLRIERSFLDLENIDLYELDITDASNKENQEFKKRDNKIRDDGNKLYRLAIDALRPCRTEASIEKNCPEMVPYINETVEACEGTNLSDLASCMRTKDDC